MALHDRRITIVASIAAITVTVFVLAGVTNATEKDRQAAERFEHVAEARMSGDDAVIARIGSADITSREFLAKVAVVESNLDFMRSQLQQGVEGADFMTKRIELIEHAGIETVALAGLLEERALYQRAVNEGHAVSADKIMARVSADRDAIQRGAAPEVMGYVRAVGEDIYWSTIYPAVMEREMAIQNLWSSVVGDLDPVQARTAWNDVQRQAVGATTVDFIDPTAMGAATIKGALDYLAQVYSLPV
jgi:hypothetical protein